MADSDTGPMFRANKRRKVFRKRPDDDADNNDETSPATTTTQDQRQDRTSTNEPTAALNEDEDEAGVSEASVPRPRRPRNYGIAFSSSDRPPSRPQENALVVAQSQPAHPQINRFTRQTGKAVVEDDKHMSAYIESKMAEMRAAALSSNTPSEQSNTILETQNPDRSPLHPADTAKDPALGSPSIPPPAHSKAPQPPKHRRGRKNRAPSPSSQARASLIDQIMHESNHNPHYNPHYTTPQLAEDDDTADPDAAAAEAFKTQFLAHAEARNLSRRKPAPKKATGPAAAPAAPNLSGPKLGGSRAARNKMRAAAKEGEGK